MQNIAKNQLYAVTIILFFLLFATQAKAVMPWQYDTFKYGDFYIYNNTNAAASINTGDFGHKGFPASVPAMGIAAETGLDIKDSGSANQGTMYITLADGSKFGIWGETGGRNTGGAATTYTLVTAGDSSWNTDNTKVAASGAKSLVMASGQRGTGEVEQIWNKNYVISLFTADGDDTTSPTGTKIILMISPNLPSSFKDGIDDNSPW